MWQQDRFPEFKTFVNYFFIFLIGATCSYLYLQTPARDLKNYQSSSVVRKTSDNKLISPLLLTGDSKTTFVKDTFTEKISKYIDTAKQNGDANDISYYVKNLRNSTWTGIDEDNHYAPASLMKVPIMMAVLKESEKTPGLLQKKIKYFGKSNLNDDETYKPRQSLQSGQTYTVEELLEYMAKYSDNNAMELLVSSIPTKRIIDILFY